jgi:hypothetical protein
MTAAWLVARELRVHWRRVAVAGAAVTALAAASTATELVTRGREEAVAAQIDQIGVALTVIPSGLGSSALARLDLSDRLLPPGLGARVAEALGPDLRATDVRLVLVREVSGVPTPVIGLAPGSIRSGALLGAELARRLGSPPAVSVEGRQFRVEGVQPSAGSADDLAVFVPLTSAQALAGAGAATNVIRVFLRAGVAPREAEDRLRAAALRAEVVRTDRGEVADDATQESLARHRHAGYAVMAAVAALCLFIAAHLDTSERRIELATLAAMGAGRSTILGAVIARSTVVASAGALVGVGAGAVLAAGPLAGAAGIPVRWADVAVATVAVAAAIGALAAVPTGVGATMRDPVADLQET